MKSPITPPAHVALIMDGNGRWAQKRNRPRSMGHQAGIKALRSSVEHCIRKDIQILTVFAFSTENWNRPEKEVSRLMDLFLRALDKEVARLHENQVRVCFIGDRSAFSADIRESMARAEVLTENNHQLVLNVAANYGGRWDITQAVRIIGEQVANGDLQIRDIDENLISTCMSLAGQPDPDLFIRTGGEKRISNFLLWQTAYSELVFSDVLWPDFDAGEFDRAISEFHTRERRYGKTGQQVRIKAGA
jgi:undecaprenyl diphosphate synthase